MNTRLMRFCAQGKVQKARNFGIRRRRMLFLDFHSGRDQHGPRMLSRKEGTSRVTFEPLLPDVQQPRRSSDCRRGSSGLEHADYGKEKEEMTWVMEFVSPAEAILNAR